MVLIKNPRILVCIRHEQIKSRNISGHLDLSILRLVIVKEIFLKPRIKCWNVLVVYCMPKCSRTSLYFSLNIVTLVFSSVCT